MLWPLWVYQHFEWEGIKVNAFVKSLLLKFLRAEEAALKAKLAAFLTSQGDKLLEDVIQPGGLRNAAEKFLADNVIVASDYLFDAAVKFVEGA